MRQRGGLMGYPNPNESDFDLFMTGHAGASVSSVLGLKAGDDLLGEGDRKAVAVIGDGAMTCGLAYEALNNAGHTERDFVVVLNDNDMSIGPAVGAMNKYLTGMITNPAHNKVPNLVRDVLHRTPQARAEMVGRPEDQVPDPAGGGWAA